MTLRATRCAAAGSVSLGYCHGGGSNGPVAAGRVGPGTRVQQAQGSRGAPGASDQQAQRSSAPGAPGTGPTHAVGLFWASMTSSVLPRPRCRTILGEYDVIRFFTRVKAISGNTVT
jgi:hypothetical protein